MKNLLIGAVSGNFNISDVNRWVESSKGFGCDRILFLYNNTNSELLNYLIDNDIDVISPEFDLYALPVETFETNTSKNTLQSSYILIHNVRFLHIWKLLDDRDYAKVLVTDVRDVYFNRDPFDILPNDKLLATSEEISYEKESWNNAHLFHNLGMIGSKLLTDKNVFNVGVFGGSGNLVKEISKDIYLLSVGKQLVADQTSFNYLIQTNYKNDVVFTGLNDKFAVHLDVISKGLVPFDMNTIDDYVIVHQYDRL